MGVCWLAAMPCSGTVGRGDMQRGVGGSSCYRNPRRRWESVGLGRCCGDLRLRTMDMGCCRGKALPWRERGRFGCWAAEGRPWGFGARDKEEERLRVLPWHNKREGMALAEWNPGIEEVMIPGLWRSGSREGALLKEAWGMARLEIVAELDGGGAMAGLLLTPVEEGVSVGFAAPVGEMERERDGFRFVGIRIVGIRLGCMIRLRFDLVVGFGLN